MATSYRGLNIANKTMKKSFIMMALLTSVIYLSAINFCYAGNAYVSGFWLMNMVYPPQTVHVEKRTVWYDGHEDFESYDEINDALLPSFAAIIDQFSDGTISGSQSQFGVTQDIAGTVSGNDVTFTRNLIVNVESVPIISTTTIIENWTGQVIGRTIQGTIEGSFYETSVYYLSAATIYKTSTGEVTGSFTISLDPAPQVIFFDKELPCQEVVGAGADGESKVIIELFCGIYDDDVEISITNGDEDGRLENDGKMDYGIFTQTYIPPACFVRSGHPEDLTASERFVDMTITVDGGEIEFEPLSLIHPPVVMVHGLWSNPGAFSELGDVLVEKGWLYLYCSSYNNSASFDKNIPIVKRDITNSMEVTKRAGYAVKKVDVVAHSMGGCLTKSIDKTFLRQNVRKIITIGTPYEGSPLADSLYQYLLDHPYQAGWTQTVIDWAMHTQNSITGGAIYDLRSADINSKLPISTQIPGVDCREVMVGLRDGSLERSTGIQFIFRLLTGASMQEAHDIMFGQNVRSDWIVSESSQKHDALHPREISVAWHCTETQDADFKTIVVETLNKAAYAGSTITMKFCTPNYEATNNESAKPKYKLDTVDIYGTATSETNGTVEIIAPTEGKICRAGESITISVQGTGDTSKAVVFALFGSRSYGEIVDLPWHEEINVPANSVGSIAKIMVMGLDINMNMTDEDEVNLVLESDIVLQEIFFGFGDTWYFDFMTDPTQSRQWQLYPMGRFSDSSEHPLSIVGAQTDYYSSNPTVATVDANGVVTAITPGSAVITITNSAKTTTFNVEVQAFSGDVNLDGIVNFRDFAVFASAWMSKQGEMNWNPACDISQPKDNIIDLRDLAMSNFFWLMSVRHDLSIAGDFDGNGREDLADFAVFASAWTSQLGQPNWNPACDISDPEDNIINWSDLAVFAEDWLAGVE